MMPEFLTFENPDFDRNYGFMGRVISGGIDHCDVFSAACTVLKFINHFK